MFYFIKKNSPTNRSFQKTLLAILVFFFPLMSSAENPVLLNLNLQSILISKNEVKTNKSAVSIRQRNRAKRRKAARDAQLIKPQYAACKDVDLSSITLKKDSKKSTEAEYCFDCELKKVSTSTEILQTGRTIQTEVFKKKLQERVKGAILAKLYQTKALHACATEDKNLLRKLNIDWEAIKGECSQKSKELKASIKDRWPEMRIQLALKAPALRENRILANRATWYDPTPSHSISDFSDLPKLTQQERKKAENIYLNTLSKVPLESLSSSELKQKLKSKKSLYSFLSAKKPLTSKDQSRLRKAASDLRKEAGKSYSQIVSEMPLLGYLKTGEPKKQELKEAFTKMEEKLEVFLKKAEKPDVDMGLLLSFKPLVEELLKNNKDYCLVAEKSRIQAEKDKSLENWAMLGAGVIAAVPCLISGPIGATICLSFGMGLGVVGYAEAQVAKGEALGRVLTGKEFETIADLEEKEREELLEKLFLPLGAWGTTAGSFKAAKNVISKLPIDPEIQFEIARWIKGTLQKWETTEIKRIIGKEELKIPKISEETAQLQKQGFNRNFIGGLDEMNEMIDIGKQLRKLEVDPYTTHIDYFAEKMKEHLDFMEKAVKNPIQREKMNLVREYAEKAIAERSVTYEKWIQFHEVLVEVPLKGMPYGKIERISEYQDRIIKDFPQVILMPTTRDSGMMTMSRGIENDIYILGISNKSKVEFDNMGGNSVSFYDHDLGHTGEILKYKKDFDVFERMEKVAEKIKNLPPKKRKNAEYIYWLAIHEAPLDFIHNVSIESVRAIVKHRILNAINLSKKKRQRIEDDFMEAYISAYPEK